MLFVIDINRLRTYFHNVTAGKINGIYDWTYSELDILYIFIHHAGREYVFYQAYSEFEDVPMDIKMWLDEQHELLGVLQESEIFMPDDLIDEEDKPENTNFMPELNRVIF